MPTINYQNRQATTPFLITNGLELDVLATTDSSNDYQDGMSVNGGATLHLEIDASLAPDILDIKIYRRSDSLSVWASFWVDTVPNGKVFSADFGGLSGYSDVRVTLQSTGNDGKITVAAKITTFPAFAQQP